MKPLIANAPLGQVSGFGRFAPGEVIGGTGTAASQIESIFTVIFGFLTVVAGLAFLVYFIIGAINWVLAGGDSKKVDTAKSYMTNGAVGMVIIVATYSIIWIVGQVLGFDILNPAIYINNLNNPGASSTQGMPQDLQLQIAPSNRGSNP